MKTSEVKVPGKLYVAGEYAVVTPEQPAILVAVDRFLTLTFEETTNDFGTLNSKNHTKESLNWHLNANGIFQFDDSTHSLEIIESTIQTVQTFFKEKLNIQSKYFDITIKSDLDFDNGEKIGLGSSAAVSVALVKNLSKYFNVSLTKQEIFKLACISHLRLNSRGSFGDIATITYTGWIYYKSFNRDYIDQLLGQQTLVDVVDMNWPGLVIEQIKLPNAPKILVGWTKSPASTEQLVGKVQETENKSFSYDKFLLESQLFVDRLKQALLSNDYTGIKNYMSLSRNLLNTLAEAKNITIETSELTALIETSLKYGYAAKSSGSGGGDCGISLVTSTNRHMETVALEWERSGIIPLPLSVFTEIG